LKSFKMNNYNQLKDVLNDIFELNKADLDFGIYRIINQKRKQVNEFIEKQLPEDIRQTLSETQSSDKAEIENELKDLKRKIEALDEVAETHPKYIAKLEQLKLAENTDVLEQEVFSHLANFFKRYYKDGDFISMRRYKKDVYAIPYEGEEVKLHWANHDQYYIKSSENFKNYSLKTSDGKTVTFQLKEVSTEQNNNKTQGDAERRFALYAEQPVEESENELFINFIYEPFTKATKQENLLTEALEVLSEQIPAAYATVFTLSPTEKNSKRTLLEKHLNDYVSKNSFDYFIHKDLGGFLSRELDFYIKNEVLYLDDINTKQTEFFVAQLSKVKAIRAVAGKVIEFLAQIENFQKKLWLKKKFVIRTDYCITLDKVPSTYYPEILQNQAQLAEWKTLFDVDIQNAEQLNFEQFLVLDTQFFDEVFKDRLLAEFEKKLSKEEGEQKALIQQKGETEKELRINEETISRINQAIEILSKDISQKEGRISKIQEWKVKIEESGIKPIEYQTNESLDNLFKNFERNFGERDDIKNRKDRLFENLKTKTETAFAFEDEFIKYLDSELATLEDKQKSIDALLKNISTQFSIPCKTLYSKFQEFEAFINNQFNSKIRKIKISDIDSLNIEILPNENLIKDLKKVMEIRDLTSELIFDDQSENLNVLNRYLDNQAVIDFKDLFDIKLHLDKKGQHKVVDLRNQIESDGTDKMIRMVIIMSIIHQIVINDVENKIVIFVDEIGTIDEANRIEILNFCKENNFVPISAAPLHPYDGFDKYYLVRRSTGKIILSETNGNVIYRKKKSK